MKPPVQNCIGSIGLLLISLFFVLQCPPALISILAPARTRGPLFFILKFRFPHVRWTINRHSLNDNLLSVLFQKDDLTQKRLLGRRGFAKVLRVCRHFSVMLVLSPLSLAMEKCGTVQECILDVNTWLLLSAFQATTQGSENMAEQTYKLLLMLLFSLKWNS